MPAPVKKSVKQKPIEAAFAVGPADAVLALMGHI